MSSSTKQWTHGSSAVITLASTAYAIESSTSYPCALFRSEATLLCETVEQSRLRYAYEVGLLIPLEAQAKQTADNLTATLRACEETRGNCAATSEEAEAVRAALAATRERVIRSERSVAEAAGRVGALESQVAILSGGWTEDQEKARAEAELLRDRGGAIAERARAQLSRARADEANATVNVEARLAARVQAEAAAVASATALDALRANVADLGRKRDAALQRTDRLRGNLQSAAQDGAARAAELAAGAISAAAVLVALREDEQALANGPRVLTALATKATTLASEVDVALSRNANLAKDIADAEAALNTSRLETSRARADAEKAAKLKALADAKTAEANASEVTLTARIAGLAREGDAAEAGALAATHSAASARLIAEAANREKEALAKGLTKAGDKARAASAAAGYQTAALNAMKTQVSALAARAVVRAHEYNTICALRDASVVEAAAATARFIAATDKGAVAGNAAAEMERRRAALAAKLHDTMADRGVAASARASAARALEAAHAALKEAQAELKSVGERMSLLRAECAAKDGDMVVFHLAQSRAQSATAVSDAEVAALRVSAATTCQLSATAASEALRLAALQSEAEVELIRQARARREAEAESHMLSTNSTDRRSALFALYEKLAAQRMAMAAGVRAWASLSAERDTAMHTVSKLKAIDTAGAEGATAAAAASAEMCALEGDVAHARVKLAILTRSASMPLNLHRWRDLAERDPRRWAELQRSHAAQKRLLEMGDAAAVTAAEADAELLRADTVQRSLDRSPAHAADAAEALSALGAELKDKTAKLRALEVEREVAAKRVAEARIVLQQTKDALDAVNMTHARTAAKAARRISKTTTTENNSQSNGAALLPLGATLGTATTMTRPRGGSVGGVVTVTATAAAAATVEAAADAVLARWEGKTNE